MSLLPVAHYIILLWWRLQESFNEFLISSYLGTFTASRDSAREVLDREKDSNVSFIRGRGTLRKRQNAGVSASRCGLGPL